MPSTSSVLKATTLHTFFNGESIPRPAVSVAGACRSSCVSKPSKCILDVNNAELQAEFKSSKCARIARNKAVQSESEDKASITHASDVSSDTASDVGGNTDVEMEDSDPIIAEDAYALTKAMGDQDRKVSTHQQSPQPPHHNLKLTYLSRFYVLSQSLIIWPMYEPYSSLRKGVLMQLWVISKMDMYAQSVSAYSFFSINLSLTDGVQRGTCVSTKKLLLSRKCYNSSQSYF